MLRPPLTLQIQPLTRRGHSINRGQDWVKEFARSPLQPQQQEQPRGWAWTIVLQQNRMQCKQTQRVRVGVTKHLVR